MFERLSEYIDNELDTLTCEDIETHASTCISCKVCLETLKRTIDLCKSSGSRTVPKEFSHRLMETISQINKTP
jgi:hypothetical protein